MKATVLTNGKASILV